MARSKHHGRRSAWVEILCMLWDEAHPSFEAGTLNDKWSMKLALVFSACVYWLSGTIGFWHTRQSAQFVVQIYERYIVNQEGPTTGNSKSKGVGRGRTSHKGERYKDAHNVTVRAICVTATSIFRSLKDSHCKQKIFNNLHYGFYLKVMPPLSPMFLKDRAVFSTT